MDAAPPALHFSAVETEAALARMRAGVFAAWNPGDPKTALSPGMKVTFFGAARGCAPAHEGPVTGVPDAELAAAAARTGVRADKAPASVRWTPSGQTPACEPAAHDRRGEALAYLNVDPVAGGFGLWTQAGGTGDRALLGPLGVRGQNGAGANAHITGTFVQFREAWWRDDAVRPWAGGAAAGLRSRQTVGSATADAAPGQVAQAKQQMMATFLNRPCLRTRSGNRPPCQIQYLFNTAIVRAGVSDWSGVDWFRQGRVWIDPVQGGMPIVDGPVKAAGEETLDSRTRLVLYRSRGAPTQHRPFTAFAFDVTIGFDELKNALRLAVAQERGVKRDPLTDDDVAARWGAAWNDPAAWVLVSGFVGQEVYNPDPTRQAAIGGGFQDLDIGPRK